jgi:CRP/FNR family transcriptional regulator, cyclic AMP receptor protein
MASKQNPSFDPKSFLAKVGEGRSIGKYRKDQIVFSQGDPADAIFYIQKGKAKVTVVSEQGKEAVVAISRTGRFLRRGVPGRTAAAHGDGLDHGGGPIHAARKSVRCPCDP